MTGWRKRTIEMAQEPVVCKHEWFRTGAMEQTEFRCIKCGVWNNTTPLQRTWVGLTDEDEIDWEEGGNLKDLVKAIEAKLKELNT